eukprot:TRINITY_DN351_c0_g2_i4.p1 TRINITY_DN351_c0_g2~~TRINITY_DN351_c0_g2_i4.p1  ORF type:complete len:122 (+),score=30.34 TRINITY_DN351_c0_g2_i4:64-429(+)
MYQTGQQFKQPQAQQFPAQPQQFGAQGFPPGGFQQQGAFPQQFAAGAQVTPAAVAQDRKELNIQFNDDPKGSSLTQEELENLYLKEKYMLRQQELMMLTHMYEFLSRGGEELISKLVVVRV